MKTKIKVWQEVDIKSVIIDIQPRYIGDSEDDDLPTDFPLLNQAKTKWLARVDIDTGSIDGWPQGGKRSMHVKVCDAGIYSLCDQNNDVVAVKNGYVPNELIPGEYGDYIIMDIDENGFITNWPKNPDLSEFFELDD